MGAKKQESPTEAALSRVRAICYGFPGAEEKLSHGAPSFHVRGKMFLNFVDNHHADGRLAVWCKCSPARRDPLVAALPDRYFVPPYVGVRGWLGARLDKAETDWVELAILIEEGWLGVAPPKLARGEGPAPGPRPPPPTRLVTDEKTARAGLERLTEICLAFPEATRDREGPHASFLVGKKTFAYFLDNHHGDGMIVACVRGDRSANEKQVKADPKHFCSPAYMGPRGWLGVRLEAAKVDWKDLAARVEASYREAAPKKLLAATAAASTKSAGPGAKKAKKATRARAATRG